MKIKLGAQVMEAGSPIKDLDCDVVSPEKSQEDILLLKSIPRNVLYSLNNEELDKGNESYHKTMSHAQFHLQNTSAIELEKKHK